MPYDAGKRLPGERASRLGHLEVLKSNLVNKLCTSFECPADSAPSPALDWEAFPCEGEPLPIVFGIDGSLQVIHADTPPQRDLAFVKTALLRIDQFALSRIDKDTPHPFALRDVLSQSALYHSTVFPLRNVSIPGMNTYDAIRQIIFESLKDSSLEGEPLETLKWLVYEKWDERRKALPPFQCPHCEQDVATLPYDADEGICPNSSCRGKLFVTDMLGFHQEMTIDSAPDSIATAYMNVHETLLLFTGIRFFWEGQRQLLATCLFVKDGPLSIRAQYSKLVDPIRRFLVFAKGQGHMVHILGQEKTGKFVDHLQLVGRQAPVRSLFIPSTVYVREQIQHRTSGGDPYGMYTNYGAKVFVKMNDYHRMVLNIPTGAYNREPTLADLIGADRILATLPQILSNRYEGALLPIELAHGVASLSTYPSAPILKIFAEQAVKSVSKR